MNLRPEVDGELGGGWDLGRVVLGVEARELRGVHVLSQHRTERCAWLGGETHAHTDTEKDMETERPRVRETERQRDRDTVEATEEREREREREREET
eukprot:1911354-Rhodomonas_salina.1